MHSDFSTVDSGSSSKRRTRIGPFTSNASLLLAISWGDIWSAPCLKKGMAGCDATAASTLSSSIKVIAKLPVRHIPMTPTPSTPRVSRTWRHSKRSQSATGLEASVAMSRNSLRMHMTRARFPPIEIFPSGPKRWGITTSWPASISLSASRSVS